VNVINRGFFKNSTRRNRIMKKPGWKTLITVFVILGTMFIYSNAYSGGYSRPDSGDAPYGVAYQSDAAGTKIAGVCVIDFPDYIPPVSNPTNPLYPGDLATVARVVLRLEVPGQLEVFYSEIPGSFHLFDDPYSTQVQLISWFENSVVAAFGEPGQNLTLRDVSEFASVNLLDGVTPMIFRDQTDAAVCPPGGKKCEQDWTFEDCNNGMDDNGDGYVDMADALCRIVPTIAVMNVEFALK
jgi:hypothetical protein